MGEIYPLGQDRQYLLTRAARHRRAGRYDQAMTLLTKAKEQFGDCEEVEFELAGVYDEMGCTQEAGRAYLRTARMGGKLCSKALFHLAIDSAQRSDLNRAVSYFEAFSATGDDGVSPHAAQLLRRQLIAAMEKPCAKTRKQRANDLARRATERLTAGKLYAAKRTAAHSLVLLETASAHVLKACCHLMADEGTDAVNEAVAALALRPRYFQAKCVLIDAYMMTGDQHLAEKTLISAAFRAKSSDALLSAAIESAKIGKDELTLLLTRRILKREPYHVQALALRACAHVNLGNMRSARKLFARLSTLKPEDTVYDSYYRAIEEGDCFAHRLMFAQDVTEQEAMERSVRLVELLHEDPEEVRNDKSRIDEICRLARWAIYSSMAGENITFIAVILLSVVNTPETREILLDALTDPSLDDGLKSSVIQAISAHSEQKPRYADLGGRYVRLAAGTTIPMLRGNQACQEVVQKAANALLVSYPDAAEKLLDMWAGYLSRYGAVRGKMTDACASALEYAYHNRAGRNVSMRAIAARYGVSGRLAMFCARRMLRMNNQAYI